MPNKSSFLFLEAAVTSGGVYVSLQAVNQWLTFVGLLCSAILGVLAIVKLFKTKK